LIDIALADAATGEDELGRLSRRERRMTDAVEIRAHNPLPLDLRTKCRKLTRRSLDGVYYILAEGWDTEFSRT